ncbi:hypothetical protein M441DRAFT_251830 [Trichoderma asperellum CBS 433.97]|uniref:AMP-activated protein kinase glycogen-binding domain-containing protein n=1 Tax=Trichoderma asperellum (strain ATCC 204424 / CBS 433.97 / NBRC 101777) TaxID=1042311 RepID=A0A2T3Z0X0_TRIA4|nr:hypothetical protein M441DRAFT_251830 [Trichoderma asperellum CBS 433.97]PTB38424.1 hypothetical protein M441DRAFT_251830 [Trichoderma asperellum CBS 433.97]
MAHTHTPFTPRPPECQTEPSVQSVRLIGSWDNFTMCYSMERDARRGHGQWRGCFTFQNIVCDDENPHHNKRSGGLKMGHTYYYYYEVDGSTETFDATMPCTTMCPYMPGQTVNTLFVPIERSSRSRSASTSSIHADDYRTMDPATKFMKPLPPTPLLPSIYNCRALSAPISRPSSSSSRSPSPPSWKRFFSRKPQTSDGLHRPSASHGESCFASTFTIYDNVITVPTHDARHGRTTSSLSEGARARYISPDSLSRILREDRLAPRRPSHPVQPPPLIIPDDVIEEDEDDENFAVSAISESLPYATGLSPPPFQRSLSSESIKYDTEKGNFTASMAGPPLSVRPPALDRNQPLSAVVNETKSVPRWSISAKDKVTASPIHEDVPMSFYDDEDDDDDVMSSNEDDVHFPSIPISKTQLHSFKGYSLPRHIEETKDTFASHQAFAAPISPKLVPSGSNLLDTHIEAGLDDFVSELGWIVGTIGTTDSP